MIVDSRATTGDRLASATLTSSLTFRTPAEADLKLACGATQHLVRALRKTRGNMTQTSADRLAQAGRKERLRLREYCSSMYSTRVRGVEVYTVIALVYCNIYIVHNK